MDDILAATLQKMNRYEEALDNYNLAIEKNPEDSKYFNNKAVTLQKMNRHEEAFDNYNLAIEKNPEDSGYYCQKGSIKNC
ncbi:unnamed protein product (macronuclear) [Paramecium tetraurelia]|uniref:Uncharacterized protein n=1 Tax=Paramecium tetraurelia TaxID=5888 RepID=A0BDB7_PARTE|nr:uncharacterized protein GSPATT00027562001 [Paramecium tetraurelia]CAK56534.1 unnamed protein product [Paramecium tetraurelia]|eukprot:XP_001423932.1 hypothetical protein (macronuclear) [Paramecium tetraurelia strain d4-2]